MYIWWDEIWRERGNPDAAAAELHHHTPSLCGFENLHSVCVAFHPPRLKIDHQFRLSVEIYDLYRVGWALTVITVSSMPDASTEQTYQGLFENSGRCREGIFGFTYHMSDGKRLNVNPSEQCSCTQAKSIPSLIKNRVLSCKIVEACVAPTPALLPDGWMDGLRLRADLCSNCHLTHMISVFCFACIICV